MTRLPVPAACRPIARRFLLVVSLCSVHLALLLGFAWEFHNRERAPGEAWTPPEAIYFYGWDAPGYMEPIESLIEGRGFPGWHRMPGMLPLYGPIAFASRLLAPGDWRHVARTAYVLALVACLAATIVVAGNLAARLTGRLGARRLVAVVATLGAHPFYFPIHDMLNETPAAFCVACTLALWSRMSDARGASRPRDAALLGFLLTWLFFLRPLMGLLLALFGALLVAHCRTTVVRNGAHPRRALAALLAFGVPFVVCEGLWVGKNYLQAHRLVFLAEVSGQRWMARSTSLDQRFAALMGRMAEHGSGVRARDQRILSGSARAEEMPPRLINGPEDGRRMAELQAIYRQVGWKWDWDLPPGLRKRQHRGLELVDELRASYRSHHPIHYRVGAGLTFLAQQLVRVDSIAGLVRLAGEGAPGGPIELLYSRIYRATSDLTLLFGTVAGLAMLLRLAAERRSLGTLALAAVVPVTYAANAFFAYAAGIRYALPVLPAIWIGIALLPVGVSSRTGSRASGPAVEPVTG